MSGLIEGDGCIHKKRNVIHYGSVSETLIKDVSLLFQSIGIVPERFITIRKKGGIVKGKEITNRFPFFYLEVRGKSAQKLAYFLDLASRKKKIDLKQMIGRKAGVLKMDIVPFAGESIFSELSKRHLGGGWYEDKSGKKFRAGIKYKTGYKIRYSSDILEKDLHKDQILNWGLFEKLEKINSPLLENLKKLLNESIFFTRVEGIEKVEPQETYDFEIENKHEFIANGMVVHNCLGKFHPHGDLAVYDALIRMAQDFSLRYPLVQGQGNVGSVDGDPPAAMRYVEARLQKISDEMLADLEKDTVDFMDNFDGTLKEPVVLPSNIPNLLVNGSSGIAVGMATNIPPHNLGEVIDALVAMIDNPEIKEEKLFKIIPAPDFPTGGIITNRQGIYQAYKTGRGSFTIKARTEIEEVKGGREIIVVTEIPYQVNKASLIETIARLVKEKKITGISNIRDESDKEGIRVVIEVSRDAVAGIVLNQLYKHTSLATNFGIIMLALVNNIPKVLNLRQMLGYYLDHRVDVITRRTQFELRKAQARAHILEGLRIALENLDKVIRIIKKSKNPADAKAALVKNFKMTETQAQAILDMKLQQLTGLERMKIEEEYIEKIKLIEKLKKILSDSREIFAIIKNDLLEVKKKYADKRKTEISDEEIVINDEDLVTDSDVVLTITRHGYIKRVSLDSWRVQGRGGKGIISMKTKDDDYLEYIFITRNLATLFVFTNLGRLYWLKVWKIAEASRVSRGKAIVNFVSFKTSGEKANSFLPVPDLDKADGFLLMASEKGLIKKTNISAYSRPRASGIIALKLDEGDKLIKVKQSDGDSDIVLATRLGKAIRFPENGVRTVGRSAKGVRGIKLSSDDRVVGMVVDKPSSKRHLLVISENGYGKRTDISAYRKQRRGGKGIINMKVNEKTGPVVALISCSDDDEIMIVTTAGLTIRQKVENIRKTGRAASGVRLIRLNGGDKVASAGKVAQESAMNGGDSNQTTLRI
ncbi:MAG: DNA gyrase subunit A [Elusimicrobia bacterium]|nr:DNA gyrase subunit A [Elusimicrobiota bacterium]